MAKINLPNAIGGGVGNLVSEEEKRDSLFRDPSRSSSGQLSWEAPISGITYNTIDYTSDLSVYNKGEDGLLNLLSIYIIRDSTIDAGDINDITESIETINNEVAWIGGLW